MNTHIVYGPFSRVGSRVAYAIDALRNFRRNNSRKVYCIDMKGYWSLD